ncbi:MAG: hypothetical protein QG670_1489 [Thermoproteota archaeon]|nr:hypothetical protein [Thermoproteota archaeon]
MAKGALKVILYVVSAIFIILGIIFMISTNLGIQYFFEGLVFIALAVLLLFFSLERKPVEIKQTLEISGAPKIKEVTCPNCKAILNPETVQVIDGRPYLTCKYCGNKFELTEEPKW